MVVPGFTRASGVYGRFSYGGKDSELKWWDTNIAAGVIPYDFPSTVQNLVLVPTGTGANNRVGRAFLLKQMEAKMNIIGTWTVPATGATLIQMPSISYRVDLVLDKQCNGTTAVAGDLYDTTVAGVDPCNRFMNLFNEGRFTVLKRWEGDLNPPSSSAASTQAGVVQQSRDLVLKSKRCNIPVEFSGTVGAIAEIRSNNVFVIFTCTQPQGALGAAQCTFALNTANFRMRFLDS